MPRRRIPRSSMSVISELRSRVLKSLRVIYDDGVLLVSPSLGDAELECVLLEILSFKPLSVIDIQVVFSGLASGERIRRVLDDLVRRGLVRVENGVYCVSSLKACFT
jgi:hypothetical protein